MKGLKSIKTPQETKGVVFSETGPKESVLPKDFRPYGAQ
jgi:hypothetical protein